MPWQRCKQSLRRYFCTPIVTAALPDFWPIRLELCITLPLSSGLGVACLLSLSTPAAVATTSARSPNYARA